MTLAQCPVLGHLPSGCGSCPWCLQKDPLQRDRDPAASSQRWESSLHPTICRAVPQISFVCEDCKKRGYTQACASAPLGWEGDRRGGGGHSQSGLALHQGEKGVVQAWGKEQDRRPGASRENVKPWVWGHPPPFTTFHCTTQETGVLWKLREGLDSTPKLASPGAEDPRELEEHREKEQGPEAGGPQALGEWKLVELVSGSARPGAQSTSGPRRCSIFSFHFGKLSRNPSPSSLSRR